MTGTIGAASVAADAHLLEIAPAQFELIGSRHVGHRTAGGEVGQDHLLMSALSTSALSAMKCTPQKTMNSASGCRLTCRRACTSRRCSRRT